MAVEFSATTLKNKAFFKDVQITKACENKNQRFFDLGLAIVLGVTYTPMWIKRKK